MEIRCVDPDDQMSVDSYFFASFHDTGHVMRLIQALLDQRPDHQLPRVLSDYSEYDGEGDGDFDEQDRGSAEQGGSSENAGGRKLSIKKKLGSVLKPLVGKLKKEDGASGTGDEPEGDFTEIGPTRSRDTQGYASASTGETGDGYPPRQHGRPPHGAGADDKTWSNWLTKPVSTVSKALAPSASSKTSLLTRVSSSRSSLPQPTTPPAPAHARLHPRRSRRRKGSEVVTETVEPTVRDPDADDETSDSGNESHSDFETGTGSAYGSASDEEGHDGGNEDEAHIAHNRRLRKQASRESNLGARQRQKHRQKRGSRSSRLSFGSMSAAGSGETGSAPLTKGFGRGKREEAGYSMLDASEQGKKEDVETERKFRAVFALPESEELLDR
jgi:sterol 3beta-glucosyltransferase